MTNKIEMTHEAAVIQQQLHHFLLDSINESLVLSVEYPALVYNDDKHELIVTLMPVDGREIVIADPVDISSDTEDNSQE